ncbi:MAG: hypothetical protein ISS77_08430 [Phycisphaerae bacterium]|nr:hypothetical protein [Phycisphaerae bacterium]
MNKKTRYITISAIIAAAILIAAVAALLSTNSNSRTNSNAATNAPQTTYNTPPALSTTDKDQLIKEHLAQYDQQMKDAREANDVEKFEEMLNELNAKLQQAEKQRVDELKKKLTSDPRPEFDIREEMEKAK